MRKSLTLTIDAWGNIIVAGPIPDGGPGESFVAKLDKDGNMLWQRGLTTSPSTAPRPLFSRRSAPPRSRRVSSVPPPAMVDDAAVATDSLRDSVEPQLLDGVLDDVDRYESDLVGLGRFERVWRGAGAAALAAFAIAGIGIAAQHSYQAPAAAALMQHNVQREARMVGELPREQAELSLGHAFGAADERPGSVATASDAPPVMPLPNAKTLREETLALLTAGLPREALPHARALVAAAPHAASSYLFLGATLQDLGRRNEAREVYNDCVKLANTGNASECFALGGRR